MFNHACRYELFDRNPMRYVRQGAKRRSAPDVLTAAEIKALVDHLAVRERTLVLLAAATGLRQSELFGLKWRDVDFKRGEFSVIRSIVFGVVGRCKTESSQKPVPLHPLLGEALLTWRKTCNFTGVDDWIFASRLHKGRRPYWGASILRDYVRPLPRLSTFRSASAGLPVRRERRVAMSRLIDPVVNLEFYQISSRGKKLPPGADEFSAYLKAYIARWAGRAGMLE